MARQGCDKLLLRGLRFFGRHGAVRAERELGQRFVVDMDVYADLRAAGVSDSLDDTVDYAAVRGIARDVVEGVGDEAPSCVLVERIAHRIATRVLDENAPATAVRVRIVKPHVAVRDVDALGVEVYRERTRRNDPREAREAPRETGKTE